MREYKFRGKRLDNGEWVEGSLLKLWETVEHPHEDSCDSVCQEELFFFIVRETNIDYEFDDNMRFKVDPATVGQYTGLKDKNGKEIYEGGILDNGYEKGEVEWVQEHCAYMIFTKNPSLYQKLESDGLLEYTEVIGNIHDNPELLEG